MNPNSTHWEQALEANTDYFVLSTVYDAQTNSAGIKLYNVEKKKVIYITDTYDHEPYCFSREPLQKVQAIDFPPGTVKRIDTIIKRDILNETDEDLTRIVTPTPSEVPKVRDIVGETWESRIKYHQNWIYDVQIVPGRRYWWDSDRQRFIRSQSMSSGLDIPQNTVEHLTKYEGLSEVFHDDFTQEIPEMPIVACDIETEYTKGQIPQASDPKFRIICICFADSDGNEIALVLERKGIEKGNKPEEVPLHVQIQRFSDESSLLKQAFEILRKYSIIVTFNGDNFDFPYLHERAKHLKIGTYSPIIWNRRDKSCNFKQALHLDMYRFYHNVAIRGYAFGNRYREETLDAITQSLFGIGKIPLAKEISELSEWELISYCVRDAKITLNLLLFDNRTPLNLIFILARISRIPIDDLVRTSVSNWVRSLFYYEHRRRGYLIPNQEDLLIKGTQASSKAIIKGKKYKGALVIDPVPGVHFNVTVMDFASLYPSIIGTFNLSYETIHCSHKECKNNLVPQTNYWVCQKNRGIIADIIGFIKDVRVHWLKPESKKDTPHKNFLHILERSLKVLINASYGVIGSDRFPLYCLPVADSTTAYGRDAIEKTIQKAQSLDIQVLYGDTDSVFLHKPSKKQIDEIINWSQENLGVRLEMEKFYRYVVLSERKKNYFGVYPDSSIDVKGLMGKKRNTPPFLQEGFNSVLIMLSQVNTDEEFINAKKEVIELVRGIYQKLEKQLYSGEDLAITMQLTQPLNRYKVKAQHVKAANQLEKYYQEQHKVKYDDKKRRSSFIKAGQLIRFVKTRTADRVTPIELMNEKTKVDVKAYKSMVDSIFDQLFGALDIDVDEVSTGQINLMEFFG
ncbi:MAG: DNA-directed DNA polymerase I [Candidatus Heimdallarchaeota archaeon]|nr:MAG: DNA-directed DNA polymerase I [Candidatus Heimdallarchaeota archaeon]